LILTAGIFMWPCCSHAQSSWNFLKNAPVSHFRGDDFDRMKKNASEALDSDSPGAKRAWSNSSTGSSGFAEVRGAPFIVDGATCKHLRLSNNAGGLSSERDYTACKQPNGEWKIEPGKPPQKGAPQAK
jgi:hypothetical protein